jgi:hypothetical protein
MTKSTRRGRPPGTGKKDDPILSKVARLLVDEPALRPTAAIRRVLAKSSLRPGEMESTVVRRLQYKWKAHSEAYLAGVKGQISVKTEPKSLTVQIGALQITGVKLPANYRAIAEQAARTAEAVEAVLANSKIRRIIEAMQPTMAAQQNFLKSMEPSLAAHARIADAMKPPREISEAFARFNEMMATTQTAMASFTRQISAVQEAATAIAKQYPQR